MYQLFTSWNQCILESANYDLVCLVASFLTSGYTITKDGKQVFQLLNLTNLQGQSA